jgi:hypothetical protein
MNNGHFLQSMYGSRPSFRPSPPAVGSVTTARNIDKSFPVKFWLDRTLAAAAHGVL